MGTLRKEESAHDDALRQLDNVRYDPVHSAQSCLAFPFTLLARRMAGCLQSYTMYLLRAVRLATGRLVM